VVTVDVDPHLAIGFDVQLGRWSESQLPGSLGRIPIPGHEPQR
jgi:hypothetical protein